MVFSYFSWNKQVPRPELHLRTWALNISTKSIIPTQSYPACENALSTALAVNETSKDGFDIEVTSDTGTRGDDARRIWTSEVEGLVVHWMRTATRLLRMVLDRRRSGFESRWLTYAYLCAVTF
jgi:hypothetical protein